MKFFIVSVALCLFNLNATDVATSSSAADVPPALVFNPEELAKPTGMSSMQWIDALEHDRNTADCIGNFAAFKALTKEISATIGGKYGFAIPTTQDEIITLSYSIIRTRHKFCGKLNMLSDFYGIKTAVIDPQTQQYLAMVLAIDAMAFEAIDEEGDPFFDQWTAVKAKDPVAAAFVATVKGCVQVQEKAPLVAALDAPLTAFLAANSETIALAKEVFDVFAPKITLKKIYTEMVGGEYHGWTVHGADAFAYPVVLSDQDNARYSGLQIRLTELIMQNLSNQVAQKETGLPCCSLTAHYASSDMIEMLSLSPGDIILDYIFVSSLDEVLKGFIDLEKIPAKHLFLTRKINPAVTSVIEKPFCRILSENILDKEIKRSIRIERNFIISNQIKIDEDFLYFLESGDRRAIAYYSLVLYNGIRGVRKDILKAIAMLRDAADLGCDEALAALPDAIYGYAVSMFSGQNGIARDMLQAVELTRESKALGSKKAQQLLPSILNSCVSLMVNGTEGVAKNPLRALTFCQEAKGLGNRDAERNLPICLEFYIDSLFYGENGVEKDAVTAIEFCRKMADSFESINAEQQLPLYLFKYGIWLYNGEEGIAKDIPKSIESLRESADLEFEKARKFLPSIMYNYSVLLVNGENDITRDMQKAVKFCRDSASLGCEEARKNLPIFTFDYGLCLFKGENSIKQDLGEATAMFMESADLGNIEANAILGELRDFVTRDNVDMWQKLSIEGALSGMTRLSGTLTRERERRMFRGFVRLDLIMNEVLKYCGEQSSISDEEDEF
jgi:TPR repeat protein